MDRQPFDLDTCAVQLVEQFAERVHGVVGRDLQNELVLVGTGRREQLCGRVELVQVSEMEPDVAARDAAFQLGGCSFSDDPAAVEHRDLVGQTVGLAMTLVDQPRVIFHMVRRLRGSKPVVGSSRKITRG